MAGGAWKVMGAIEIPNSRFEIDTDFSYVTGVGDQVPDGWTKIAQAQFAYTVALGDGYSDGRALHILVNDDSMQVAALRSAPSSSLALPIPIWYAFYPKRIRMLAKYKKSLDNGQVLRFKLTVYNANESSSASFLFPGKTAVALDWTTYDETIEVNFARNTLGFDADHVRVTIEIIGSFGSGVAVTYQIDDLACGFKLSDTSTAVAPSSPYGYDVFQSAPKVAGFSPMMKSQGRFIRGEYGGMRFIDSTGGTIAAQMRVNFPALTAADRDLLMAMIRLNSGDYTPDSVFAAEGSPRTAPCPVVIEPDPGDRSTGRFPPWFYAWLTNVSDIEPASPERWSCSVTAEEVC